MLVITRLTGPVVAERSARTPWHPHHISERYGLLMIITLGEVILGTVAALNAVLRTEAGWTVEAALLGGRRRRTRLSRAGGCTSRWRGSSRLFAGRDAGRASCSATGISRSSRRSPRWARPPRRRVHARGEAKIGAVGTVLSVVIPFAIFALAFYAVYSVLMHTSDPFHLWLLLATGAVLALAVVLAAAGMSVPVCLLVVVLAPVVTVVGFETLGRRKAWRRCGAA